MKRFLKFTLFFILVISLLTACGSNDNDNDNSSTEIENLPTSISENHTQGDGLQPNIREENNNLDYSSFLDLLIENGFQYSEENTVTDGFLSVVCKPILIGNETISIYEYASNEEMENDSVYIDRGGCSISTPGKGVEISWVSYPHFFKKDKVIINYIGENERILEFLNKNIGEEFAGYDYVNKNPMS